MKTNTDITRAMQASGKRVFPALLAFADLCGLLGIKADRSARLFFWRGAKNGTFPSPLKLGAAKIAWRTEEVERWLEQRPRAIYARAQEGQ